MYIVSSVFEAGIFTFNGMPKHSLLIGDDLMLTTSVWNLPSLWKGVKRVSIYMMMFLAVAMLVLPLIQPQEAEGSYVRWLVGIGVAIYLTMCPASGCHKLVGNGHLVTCYAPHGKEKVAAQYYICNEGQRWAHGGCDQN